MAKKLSKKNIPFGDYCYTITSITKATKDTPPIINIIPCPYLTRKINNDLGQEMNYCLYVEDFDLILLEDECKICGENDV